MDKKNNSLSTTCFEFEKPKANSTFGKVKIQVATHMQKANGMNFTKESMQKAMSTLDYIPIIGCYSSDKEDYTDHGQSMKITSDGIEFEKNTKPIGVVIKGSGKFEDIKAKNGEMMEYVTCEGYIWLQECPEAEVLFKGDDNAQSMEINLNSFTTNDDWTYQVDDYEYTALCVLASDGSVKPAFHEAKVLTNFESNEFKARYSEMMVALDKFIKFQEKEDDMVENEEVIVTQQEEAIETDEVETTEVEVTPEDETISETDKTEEPENVETQEMSDNDVDYKALYEESKTAIQAMQQRIDTLQSNVNDFMAKEEKAEKLSMINAYANKIEDSKFAAFTKNVDTYNKDTLKTELLSAYVESLENKTAFSQVTPTSVPTVDMFSEVTGDDLPEAVKLIKKYTNKN